MIFPGFRLISALSVLFWFSSRRPVLVPPPAFTFASVSCFKLLSSQVKASVLAGITSSIIKPNDLNCLPANVVPFPKSRVYDFPSVNVQTPIKLLSIV